MNESEAILRLLRKEIEKWKSICSVTGLGAFTTLMVTFIMFPYAVLGLARIWLILFCINYGVTLGIMYSEKIVQKGETKE